MQPKTFDATALKQAVDIKVFDLSGYIIVPGFIDLHMHITGGGTILLRGKRMGIVTLFFYCVW